MRRGKTVKEGPNVRIENGGEMNFPFSLSVLSHRHLSSFSGEALRRLLPALLGALRGGDRHHHGGPHEQAANSARMRLSAGANGLHVLRGIGKRGGSNAHRRSVLRVDLRA